MNKPFYLLKGTAYRNTDSLENIVEINEVFQNKNLLEARIQVFNKFQSFIEVFLESVNKKYKSHIQSVADLKKFIKSSKEQKIFNDPDLKVNADFDKGLFIYFVLDPSDIYITQEGETVYNDKILIYSFSSEIIEDSKIIRSGLIKEYKFYVNNRIFKSDSEQRDNTMLNESDLFDDEIIKGKYDILGETSTKDSIIR